LDLYDPAKTDVSKGALVQLALALRAYRKDMVLAGGWAPYFLTLGHFEHCGSMDIDLVLRPSVMVRYERIREIVVEALRYKASITRFSALAWLNGFKTETAKSSTVDLLEIERPAFASHLQMRLGV